MNEDQEDCIDMTKEDMDYILKHTCRMSTEMQDIKERDRKTWNAL